MDVANAKKTRMIVDFANGSTGEWLTYGLLETYLRAGNHVIFVAGQEAFPHYQAVMKKLGVELTKHIESDQLTYLDAFSQPY